MKCPNKSECESWWMECRTSCHQELERKRARERDEQDQQRDLQQRDLQISRDMDDDFYSRGR